MALKTKVDTLPFPKLQTSGAEQASLIDDLEKSIKNRLVGGWELVAMTADGGVILVVYKKDAE